MRRIDPAEDVITHGERIVAFKILFAGLGDVEQSHGRLLAERRPGGVSRPMLKSARTQYDLIKSSEKSFLDG